MENNKLIYTIVGVVAVLILGALIWWAVADTAAPPNNNERGSVPLQNDYGSKIVYTTDAETSTDALRNDCTERGGTFNECGTTCAPDADICADVCAYTCELAGDGAQETGVRIIQPQSSAVATSPLRVSGEARGSWFFEGALPVRLANASGHIIARANATSSENWMTENYIPFSAVLYFSVQERQEGRLIIAKDNPSGLPHNEAEVRIPVILEPGGESSIFSWTTYHDQGLEFSIERPNNAEVQPSDTSVTFLYTGPTQQEGTEVYDGISFTVASVTLPTATTLEEYAQTLAEGSPGLHTELLDQVQKTSVNGMSAYRWRIEGLGTFTHYLIPTGDGAGAYHISFTAPDPDNRGYQQAAQHMIASFSTR